MNQLAVEGKNDKLRMTMLLSWYITVISSFFGPYLLQVALPIGGYFFLYRGMLPLTVVLFIVWHIKRRRNPFASLSTIEKAVFFLLSMMLLYGIISVFFAISVGAWFSKYLSMGYDFCFFILAILLCKDNKICKNTIILACGTMLFCALGGFIETFTDCFFDTPYAGRPTYYFMGRWWQAPIFTFYNTNGLAASNLWMLIIAWMYLFNQWESISISFRKRALWGLAGLTCLGMFLYFVSNSRLTIMALPFLFVGLAVWLLIRYRRGLWIFAVFACFIGFIYVGEQYDQIRAQVSYVLESIMNTDEADSIQPPSVTPNNHGTMNVLVPRDPETGTIDISSDESGGVRLNLLKNSIEMLVESKGLGIGLGNAELRMEAYDNTEGITNVHCFIMEIFLEFGIFAIMPLFLVVCTIFKSWFLRLRRGRKEGNQVLLSNTLFQICAVITYPILSTVNSSSWGLSAMWLFLSYILLGCREYEFLGTENGNVLCHKRAER